MVLCVAILLILGIREQMAQKRNVEKIPIRVNINGIRGKSTVTRLITSILTEAGYKTVGKTTGTAARMIYWFQDDEDIIVRQPQGANIGEQLKVLQKAADLNAEALVCECMAVNPDYQKVFQFRMLEANIVVIVNVLEDHLDVMGPTLDQIAQAFGATIPYNGFLITIDCAYTDYFKQIAKERNTKVIIADNSKITDEYLAKFDYMIFPDNASLALAVGEALGIDEETCFKGMLNAHPDPGAMRITRIGDEDLNCTFVNGFAANDPQSTVNIWERVKELEYNTEDPIVIMNCREDRVDRTEIFVSDVFPKIQTHTLVAIGEVSEPITTAFNNGQFPNVKNYINLEYAEPDKIMETLNPLLKDRMVFGVGNIHGQGEAFIEKLLSMARDEDTQDTILIDNKEKTLG
ncbi:MAG: poly-gamma-glutamate synthase PgsB [Intestinibacter bartlettii]|uniref:poly-gamma-glutamate synthase PgsB n=1 Tax=Intestinibacter bartlettii TaxID=261299 RepID=UPI00242B529F|nr:poly-gamma-glutamate synthase PgsB [Intestinibacter bartlettii]MDU1254994.1 poly-gamma-glutamate synthase PgsB [Peptostreptococcaceae bacterium]MDU2693700.1 poly-gamma-glutamate synthase PgsB [Intestinibacter bartlettii]MDU4256313.1 poly-gamma-glutamate synthase PgsB [Intestinibacter bartlettii]MDU6198423.1 poly-gamma-glutamate synthase PgsB [Intestinibacter bartlettii]